MEDQKKLFFETVKKWGIIYGLIGVIYVFISAMLGLEENQSIAMSSVSFLITISIAFTMYFLATKEYRASNNGLMSFGKGYVICLVVGIIAGLIRGLGFYVYLTLVDPSYLDRILEAQMQAQERMGGSAPDPDQMPEFMQFFQTPEFFAFSSFFAAVLGALILGLIVAAINKKKEDYSY